VAHEQTLVIVNPAAGGGRCAANWRRLAPLARTLFPFDEEHTAARGGAVRLARQAADAGIHRVLSVGGDGTLHEVVNGIQDRPVAIGVLPLGTGNDFARSIGLPHSPEVLLRALARGGTRQIDVGEVHGERYVNIAGVGFDAEVARRVNAMRSKASGTLPYLMTAMDEAFRYQAPALSLARDGGPPDPDCPLLMVAVGNTSTYGGGMRVCPQAVVDDGLLDVLLVRPLRGWALLALLPRVFLGKHLGSASVSAGRARSLTITGPSDTPLHADGELLAGLPATFTIHPQGLSLWSPG
jgi:YegS/Rv2252/BmrU family lipid kinase